MKAEASQSLARTAGLGLERRPAGNWLGRERGSFKERGERERCESLLRGSKGPGSARCFTKLQAMLCSTCLFALCTPASLLPPSPPAYLEMMHVLRTPYSTGYDAI